MTQEALDQGCTHHWVLAAPEDEVVRGTCKLCGSQREYPASVEIFVAKNAYEEASNIGQIVRLLPDLVPEPSLVAVGSA